MAICWHSMSTLGQIVTAAIETHLGRVEDVIGLPELYLTE
jgi:hypothetical protein